MHSTPQPFTTATELKQARVLHDMSQDTLAAHLCVSREVVNRIEGGAAAFNLRIGTHAALLFAYLDASDSRVIGRPAAHKPRLNPNGEYAYTTASEIPQRLCGPDVEGLEPGTRYRMLTKRGSNLGSWNIMQRGTGSRFDDMVASSEPELSDQAWLDNTAKRFE